MRKRHLLYAVMSAFCVCFAFVQMDNSIHTNEAIDCDAQCVKDVRQSSTHLAEERRARTHLNNLRESIFKTIENSAQMLLKSKQTKHNNLIEMKLERHLNGKQVFNFISSGR